MIKAAIFDMDGTLIDSLGYWEVLWADFGRCYRKDSSFRPSAADDKAVRTLPLDQAMALIQEHYQLAESAEALSGHAAEGLKNYYIHQAGLKEGALELLEGLKQRGIRICVASATAPEYLELAMESRGIRHYFEKIFSCSLLGKGKDQPDLFLMAQEALGASVEETWVFEDSAVAVETAAGIGMPVVGIYDPNNYGQERIRELARIYIDEGESLAKALFDPAID